MELLIKKITILAKECRSQYKEKLWESTDIEQFGFNEYMGGKAEAYEECLEILQKSHNFHLQLDTKEKCLVIK